MSKKEVTQAYRKAAIKLYGCTEDQVALSIRNPEEDSTAREWAPNALAVLFFEYKDGMGSACGYWEPDGFEECLKLAKEAGVGYIEYQNAAVGGVYP